MPHKELNFKPQLAKDYNPSKLKFPLWIQPKIDGCFNGNSKVYTDQGYLRIEDIVENKMDVKVLSYNELTKQTEFKKIKNWFNNGIDPNKEWYRFGRYTVTANHKFYTGGDWKTIKDIKENELTVFKTSTEGIFTGMLLGDSVASIEKRNKILSWRFSFSVSEADEQFGKNKIELTEHILKWATTESISGYGSKVKRFTSSECRYIPYDLGIFYNLDRKSSDYGKRVKDISYTDLSAVFDDTSLAIWFFDDGSLIYNNGNELTPRLFFSVPRYSVETHSVFKKLFKNMYGCTPVIKQYGRDTRMSFNTQDSLRLLVCISKAAGSLLPRKIPEYINTTKPTINELMITIPVNSLVRKGAKELGKNLTAYDLEIEDNHNYFVNNTLVSNCRAINIQGKLVGRSLKAHGNLWTTQKFSQECFSGLDGEMVLGNNPAALNLCSDTSGAIARIKGEPELVWWCFDLLNEQTKDLGYIARYDVMFQKVFDLQFAGHTNLRTVPMIKVNSLEEYNKLKEHWLKEGYEGVIIRSDEKYKEGRSSSTKADYWRDKGFVDAEILVTGVIEGNKNNNEATVNELGRTERSSHQENKEPNGQVGSLVGTLVKDLVDPDTKVLLLKAGTICNMAPGAMTKEQRLYYFKTQHEIVGHYAKGKLFPKGILDKPRFFTFLSIRVQSDIDSDS